MAASTWSTTDKSANITLSGSNLIITATGTGGSIRGKDPKRTGKYYIEYTSTTAQGSTTSVGFAAARATLTTGSGPPTTVGPSALIGNVIGFDTFGTQVLNVGSGVSITTGTVLCCAIDLDNALVWFRSGIAGNWNGNAANNPATGVGGASLQAVGLGQGIDCYPFAYIQTSPNSITANFGGSAFAGTVPSGFTSGWDDSVSIVTNEVVTQTFVEEWAVGSPALQLTQAIIEEWTTTATVYTYWSSTDLSGITLSGGNLVATPTAAGGVRSVDGASSSAKYYWEDSFAATGNSAGVGIATSNANLANAILVGTGAAIANNAGSISVNAITQSGSIGAFSAGGVCCIALDVGAQLIWFRNGAAGNWNGSGTANPATGVGGYSIVPLGGPGMSLRAYSGGTGSGASPNTANFGDTAFVGAVPAGFTSGFPTGATLATNTIATQLALEHWTVGTPDAQLTQIALEQWAQVAGINTQVMLAQASLEHWASVAAAAVPGLGGPMISVIL